MLLSSQDLERRAREIRLLLFDVDGVLTDGSITLHSGGAESKSFFIRDGLALVWAQRAGLRVGLLSGRRSEATTRRAAELGISVVVQGENDKRMAYGHILEAQRLSDAEVAFMGDDLLDVPVLVRAGLSAAPADAVAEVRSRVHWVSQYAGGRGAAREFVELVLHARGDWDGLIDSIGS